jgi:hypothetical protein
MPMFLLAGSTFRFDLLFVDPFEDARGEQTKEGKEQRLNIQIKMISL